MFWVSVGGMMSHWRIACKTEQCRVVGYLVLEELHVRVEHVTLRDVDALCGGGGLKPYESSDSAHRNPPTQPLVL